VKRNTSRSRPTSHKPPATSHRSSSHRFFGIFPVLQTPLTEDDRVDGVAMARQVEFCVACGAHGLVFPVLGSEFQFLTDTERRDALSIVVDANRKRIPVVAGVAGASAAIAREFAAFSAKAGADAVIALPPYIAPASQDELFAYYRAVAEAAGVPVFIQHSRIAPMNPAFLVRLLREIEQVQFIKEEREPSAHNITQVAREVGKECRGIFGGSHGKWMLSELRRGATGFMPAAQTVDVYIRIWDAWQAGDEAGARRAFNAHLPLINFIQLLGLRACKEALVRRGIFPNSRMRAPGSLQLDEEDQRELGQILADLEPFMSAPA
jgi:4-hydroxy-tetrahydrodipicolinate synthase